MLDSLEKVLSSCHDFVWEVNRPPASYSTASSEVSTSISARHHPATSLDSQIEQHQNLSKSLQAKKAYYIPSTERVLSILSKGLMERRTQNGLVIKKFKDMKARFRDVRERIKRIEAEMKEVGEQLHEPAKSTAAQASASGNASPSVLKRVKNLPDFHNQGMRQSPPSGATSMASIKRFAHRITSSTASSPEFKTKSESDGPSAASTPPGRPKKSDNRRSLYGLGLAHPTTPTISTPPVRPQRSADRVTSHANPLTSSSTLPRNLHSPKYDRVASRGRPPTFSASVREKPQWKASVKRPPDSPSKRRTTLGGLGVPQSGPSTPSREPHRAASAFGHYTPANYESRYRSFTPLPDARAPSPAVSNASAATTPAHAKARPESRNSRIPMPSSQRPRGRGSLSEFGSDDGLSDPGDTSRFSRAMSPQLDPPYFNVLRQASRSVAADSGELEEVLNSPVDQSTTTPAAKDGQKVRGQLMTPEPMMRHRASKISNMTQRGGGGLRPPSAASGRSRSSMGAPGTPRRASMDPSRAATPSGLHPQQSKYGMQLDGTYKPNPWDQLDLAMENLVERQPLSLRVERIGAPLTKNMGQAQKQEDWTAQYSFQGEHDARMSGMTDGWCPL